MANYGAGNMSLADLLASGKAMGADTGVEQDEFAKMVATDPLTGSRMATEQVQNNPILSQLFGKGGAMERTNAEEQRLASQGYKLQPEDYEAYGQASGNIAREYGAQEQNLAQSLADRGLASAPNGAAAIQFTGLAGNKNEQLARAQTQIADARMNNTMNRINS